MVFDIITQWYKAHDLELQAQREQLAAAALEAPDDVELQAVVAEDLARGECAVATESFQGAGQRGTFFGDAWAAERLSGSFSPPLSLAATSNPPPPSHEPPSPIPRPVLHMYKISLIPFMVLLNTCVLRPDQYVEFYVQAFPWMPVLTPILDVLQRERAAGEAAPGADAGAAGER